MTEGSSPNQCLARQKEDLDWDWKTQEVLHCIFLEAKIPIVSNRYNCRLTSGDGSICSLHMGALDSRHPFLGVSHMTSSHI